MIEVVVNGQMAKALVDTGCTRTMVRGDLSSQAMGERVLAAVDGREVRCRGSAHAEIVVGRNMVRQEVVVMDWMVGGIDVVIGMDIISKLGGVKVSGKVVQFGDKCVVPWGEPKSAKLLDKDLGAYFDGKGRKVRNFRTGSEPLELKIKVAEYARGRPMPAKKQGHCEAEVVEEH